VKLLTNRQKERKTDRQKDTIDQRWWVSQNFAKVSYLLIFVACDVITYLTMLMSLIWIHMQIVSKI